MLGRLVGRGDSDASERSQTYSLGQMAGLIRYYANVRGATATAEEALTHSATSACADVLASSAAMLPLDAVRVVGKRRQPIEPAPSLIATPSGLVEPDVWIYQVVDSMVTDGNAFGLVAAASGAWPTQIELLDPGTVKERKVVDGVLQANVAGKAHQAFPHGDLVHIPGAYVRAGSPFADSPVRRAAESIGAALAARRFGSQFFTDGGHPASILNVDDPDLTEGQAEHIKERFLNATRGNREPAVLGSGITHQQVSVNPEDSQFIDLMRFVVEEACRFFRVPPSMVYAAISGQNITYANLNQADLQFLKYSLNRYLVRIERKLTRLLPRPQVARFNRSALLQVDVETRHKVYDRRLRNRTLTVNEVRALEDEEPFTDDDFDKPGIPGQAAPPPAEEKPDGPAAD